MEDGIWSCIRSRNCRCLECWTRERLEEEKETGKLRCEVCGQEGHVRLTCIVSAYLICEDCDYPGHRNGKSPMCTLNGRSEYPRSDNGQGPNQLFKCAMLTLCSPATDPQAKDNTILIPNKCRSPIEIFSSKLTGGIRTRREASKPEADGPRITMTVDMIKDEWDALTDEERGVFQKPLERRGKG